MSFIYILHSRKDGKLYTGFTNNLTNRLKAHLGGYVRSTQKRLPLELIHYEYFVNESDAKRREKYLKGGNGKAEVKILLKSYFEITPWLK
ncbi:GIY-YIG nuclease family protein [Candidatus Dojkabacteria bacterium]|nr:GIY-YIG nuclease family protein [Candidatus Dojkabacteria bacterium]